MLSCCQGATTFSMTTLGKMTLGLMNLIAAFIINDTRHNDTQHNGLNCDKVILSIMTLNLSNVCHYVGL